jgi:hypothetical protein
VLKVNAQRFFRAAQLVIVNQNTEKTD